MCEKYSFIVSDTPFQIWWGKGVDSHSVVREMYPASRDGAEVEWTGDLEQDLVVRHIDPKMAKMIKGLVLAHYPTRADLLPLFSGWVEYEEDKYHYRNGELDSEDGVGPARIWADGSQSWYKDGQLHREDGPARIWADGSQQWFKDGLLHRLDGPARIWADGGQSWYKDGKCHRLDGPAYIRADGGQQWWVEGIEITETEFGKKYGVK